MRLVRTFASSPFIYPRAQISQGLTLDVFHHDELGDVELIEGIYHSDVEELQLGSDFWFPVESFQSPRVFTHGFR